MKTPPKSRTITPDDYLAMLRRFLRNAGEKVGTGDPEQIADLLALKDEIDKAAAIAIARQRRTGITWVSIGEALGVTKEAVIMKWKPRLPTLP